MLRLREINASSSALTRGRSVVAKIAARKSRSVGSRPPPLCGQCIKCTARHNKGTRFAGQPVGHTGCPPRRANESVVDNEACRLEENHGHCHTFDGDWGVRVAGRGRAGGLPACWRRGSGRTRSASCCPTARRLGGGGPTALWAGAMFRSLIGEEIPDGEIRYYEEALQEGRTLVMVRAGDRYPEAMDILHRCGGKYMAAF